MQDRLQVFPGMDIDFQHHDLLDEAFIKPLFLVGAAVGGRGFSWEKPSLKLTFSPLKIDGLEDDFAFCPHLHHLQVQTCC